MKPERRAQKPAGLHCPGAPVTVLKMSTGADGDRALLVQCDACKGTRAFEPNAGPAVGGGHYLGAWRPWSRPPASGPKPGPVRR